MRSARIAVLPGDGIGPEVTAEAVRVLATVGPGAGLQFEFDHALIGGAALEAHGEPLPRQSLAAARGADAVLLGAVGAPRFDTAPRAKRPEQGLLQLRKELDLFANLRPATVFAGLEDASTLKRELVQGLNILIVRELTGDIYFGQPRGIRVLPSGEREGFDTMRYSEGEIRRIARVAFEAARRRSSRLCSVDKSNVLETTQLWREVVTDTGRDYPQVQLTHMYVDNAAMQLVRSPRQFDVILTGNMFGDILSDEASMLTGSIGMLPSASLDQNGKGLYEPIHGSAPDIAGRGIANPLAAILSAALMLRHTFAHEDAALRIEKAVQGVLAAGARTADLAGAASTPLGTRAMGDRVIAAL